MKNPIAAALRSVRDAARSQLWPIPTAGVIVALALGLVVPSIDAVVDGALPGWLDSLVFSGDAGAARTVLDAVSSSLITVTSLTFSLTVVTLQLASSQFSPRLLRTFTRDLFVQVTLAIFLATFTYSLTVLRSVRSSEESSAPFVPRIAVTVSFLLALVSVVGLVFFLAHLTRQIRVETMLANVHTDAARTAKSSLEPPDQPHRDTLVPPSNTVRLFARNSGFLTRVDGSDIVDAARSQDVIIRVDCPPGSFLVAGTPVATVWHADGRPLGAEARSALESEVTDALHVGVERTGDQDVGYGLRQLVDVANKALSPGINDPTTAVHAHGHVSALLSELARYRLGPVTHTDDQGTVRAEFARPTFADYLDIAFTQPRHYGTSDPFVADRLLLTLRDLAWTAPEHGAAIMSQLHRLTASLAGQDFDADERGRHAQLASNVEDVLAPSTRAG